MGSPLIRYDLKARRVECGPNFGVAIREDGTMVAWGTTQIRKDFPNGVKVKDVACGRSFAVAIKEDGTMVQWGDDTNDIRKGFPEGVKVKAVSCGDYHSVAIKEDGTIVQWGFGQWTREGYPGDIKAKSVACGGGATVAIKEDGTMVQWGPRHWTIPPTLKAKAVFIAHKQSPALVVAEDGTYRRFGSAGDPPAGSVKKIAPGPDYMIFLMEDGTPKLWGYGSPFPAVTLRDVAAGEKHVVGIDQDGYVVEWGKGWNTAPANLLTAPKPTVKPPEPNQLQFIEKGVTGPFEVTNGLQTRSSPSFGPHMTTILPKGTLLFRGVNKVEQFSDDLMGIQIESVSCLSPMFSVYFFPFPFVDLTVGDYSNYAIYVTTRDIPLLCLILPSKLTRGDRLRKDTPMTSCNKIDPTVLGCGMEGRQYDPCLKAEYTKEHPDVVGMIGIANEDRDEFQGILEDGDTILSRVLGTYVFPYLDNGDQTKLGGIPEIVLHPFNKALQTQYVTTRVPLAEFTEKHKEHLNYQPLIVLQRNEKRILEVMDKLTSPAGFTIDESTAPVHAKINPSTGFFQLVELSDPASLDPSQPFRFVRPPPSPATTGSSRKTRRLRRGKGKKTRKGVIQ